MFWFVKMERENCGSNPCITCWVMQNLLELVVGLTNPEEIMFEQLGDLI